MSGEQVYVTHEPRDLETVQELFSTVKNFPFGVFIALEEIESGRARRRLEGRLANSDVVVAILTKQSENDTWVNQDIGQALARGIPVLPLYESEDMVGGYVADVEGVKIDRDNPSYTIFNLLSRLRAELEPLGALSVPNWYIQFPCTVSGCGSQVVLDIERGQTKLWKMHKHGHLLEAECDGCGSTYLFDPATIGFVRRED